jgi:Flp pilus assembly protein TadG
MRNKFSHKDAGQVLVWFALSMAVFILFTALAVDFGLIYLTKARLANSVDSAVLTAAKNYQQGTTTAAGLGADMFVANYGSSAPALTWTWCSGNASCGGAISATLNAETSVHTRFMSYLPQWASVNVGDTAAATRSTLVLALVLDRSGSMCGGTITCTSGTGDDGGEALQSAVPTFIGNFIQGSDYLGMISFAGDARVDVAMTDEFVTSITGAVNGLTFNGGTFGTGAGTNIYNSTTYTTNPHGPPMSMADVLINNQVNALPASTPVSKVMVYFTDGLMNTVQDTLACTNSIGSQLYNYGGYDASAGTTFDFFNPTGDYYPADDLSYYYAGGGSNQGAGCTSTAQDYQGLCNGNPPYSATYSCKGVTKFYAQGTGSNEDFNRANITAEAQWRGIHTANAMQGETNPVYVYVIGLGNAVSGDPCVEAFLSTVANDPNGSQYSCPGAPAAFNSALAQGEFLVVPSCPGATCTAQLTQAFYTIYTKVALRLTQ